MADKEDLATPPTGDASKKTDTERTGTSSKRTSNSRRSIGTSSQKSKLLSRRCVLLHVERADVYKNFESGGGKMDLYIVIKKTDELGHSDVVGRTHTHWDGHKSPRWDWTSRVFEYNSGDSLSFTLYEDDMVGIDTKCGVATVQIDDLLGVAATETLKKGDVARGDSQYLDFQNKGETIGKVFAGASLFLASEDTFIMSQVTEANTEDFEERCQRLGVSGGTAPFFTLKVKTSRSVRSDLTESYYIGKDLGHARDEVQFYEEALRFRESAGLKQLLSFTFEYGGVLKCPCPEEQEKIRELLVLRNLHDGMKRLRLVDLKIGTKTAQAGWQGKSRSAALRQSVVDGITNSAAEGFRLEGFDGMPPALGSMDPLLDFGGSGTSKNSKKTAKKALRVMFQRMSGLEMLMYFLDVHQEPGFLGEDQLTDRFSATEYIEIIFHEMVVRLAQLGLACRQAQVPQKWIGSSVALGFDTHPDSIPKRKPEGEKNIREGIRLHIFDWGRSELNTIKKHHALSEKEQRDRARYWAYYVGGVTHLAWDAARAYWHRFCNTTGWEKVYLSVVDFDSILPDDFIGRVVLDPVKDTAETTTDLTLGGGRKFELIGGSAPSLTFSVAWKSYPAGSRLKGVWQVNVKKASHLPRYDKVLLKTTSDPFVEVTAVSADGEHCFRQRTSVVVATLNPVFDETLEIPIARGESGEESLKATLSDAGLPMADVPLHKTLLPEHRLVNSAGACCVSRRSMTQSLKHGDALQDARRIWESVLDHAPRRAPTNNEAEQEWLESLKTQRSDIMKEIRAEDASAEAEWAEVTALEEDASAVNALEENPDADVSEQVQISKGKKGTPQALDEEVIELTEASSSVDRGCRICRCQ